MAQPLAASTRIGTTVEDFKKSFMDNLYLMRGQDEMFASPNDYYITLAYTVRDRLMQRWRKTLRAHHQANPKTVYYLSAEYLLGQQLGNNLLSLGLTEVARQALAELDLDLDELLTQEIEPGLGNGGLGRLAACFLDSLATLDIPSIGYGIRYEFGIFRQSFREGWQVEKPDKWLFWGNPWEFPQPDEMVTVKFGGRTEQYTDDQGRRRTRWLPRHTVIGIPYHMMVPGYGTTTVNTLRLWEARASEEFDLEVFNTGDFSRAVQEKTFSENISKVLYPNDNTPQGRQLRLEQEYFFTACSLADIMTTYRAQHDSWDEFADYVTIQLNDTHPTIGVAELMRVFVDEEGLDWDKAWEITRSVFAYTNHTLLPEALERWPVGLFAYLLPRHLEIIYDINARFLKLVRERFPEDLDRVRRMSLIEEGGEKMVRMAHLACVGSYSINGVAALQSKLIQERLLPDFYELWPEKFNNKTNGVTPRRFIALANPRLATFITEKVGTNWLNNLEDLRQLEQYVDDTAFHKEWAAIKHHNKEVLANIIKKELGINVSPDSMFDVMVKRLHEYKRQLLKTLHIITLYQRIKDNPTVDIVPRTVVFGAKAAPGYWMAKLVIKLINSVANVVNNDPDVRDRLKVVFLPNFNVTIAERIYPAADISEQISMAGKEASGTGNMKFALNGALTTGTLDGANIEIRELVGAENFFLFGLTTQEVFDKKAAGYNPLDYYEDNLQLKRVIDGIATGTFSGGDREIFRPIVEGLLYHDEYLLLADYQSYIECQDRAEQAYTDQDQWVRMSILNSARCGYFSSDRTIEEYCKDIWGVEPVRVNDQ